MIELLTITPEQWRLLRDIRLRALQEAPQAFTSSSQEESAFEDAVWRDRAANGHSIVATDGDEPVGLATGIDASTGDPAKRELVGMWVAPSHRRQGIAKMLVGEIAEWARSQGAEFLDLGVLEGNEPARVAYVKMGFRPTGVTVPVWSDPSCSCETMQLELGSGS